MHRCLLYPYLRRNFTPVLLVPAIENQNALGLASMSFALLSFRTSLLSCLTGGPTSAAVPTETRSRYQSAPYNLLGAVY